MEKDYQLKTFSTSVVSLIGSMAVEARKAISVDTTGGGVVEARVVTASASHSVMITVGGLLVVIGVVVELGVVVDLGVVVELVVEEELTGSWVDNKALPLLMDACSCCCSRDILSQVFSAFMQGKLGRYKNKFTLCVGQIFVIGTNNFKTFLNTRIR